jgi:hypothetical protein
VKLLQVLVFVNLERQLCYHSCLTKAIFFCIFFLTVCSISFSQKKFFICNDLNEKISDANIFIDNKFYTKTDKDGIFILKTKFEELKVTHVSYNDKIMSNDISLDTIFMSYKTNTLDEIKIERFKIKKIIMPQGKIIDKLKTFNNFYSNFNSDLALFIPNEYYEDFLISKIFISVKKKYRGDNETLKLPFQVNLAYVDSISDLPSRLLLNESLIASYNNNEYVEIKLKEKVPFPKNGIFVIVSIPDISFYMDYRIGGKIYSPSFELVLNKSSKKFKSFRRVLRVQGIEESYFLWETNETIDNSNFKFGIEIEN